MIDKESLLEIANRADAVYLATVDGTSPRIRAMVNLRRQDQYPEPSQVCRADGFACYFSTSMSSGKVREVRSNPAASAYYCDPLTFRGATFSGKMEILTGPELKKALWDEGWRIYWTGADDPDYVILRLKPTEATGWYAGKPFHVDLRKL
ncbi:MAG TPA: pyridoxamine 5'-phosphate oxidase family protein [Clostridia bacterium]|nr:pyridoxamine 5'-phosphate oxidase family protein [Clostridia bacterium]